MGIELDILRELASINATRAELMSISKVVNNEIGQGDFLCRFNRIIDQISKSYDIVTEHLRGFTSLNSEESFVGSFDNCHEAYTACYLKVISKPRHYADDAYEDYLLLKTSKEIQTSYPLLKRTYQRLDQFIDKWITNDAWLAMGIDNLFKRLQTLLNEIADLKKKDPVDAYIVFDSAFRAIESQLSLLEVSTGKAMVA